MPCERRTIRKNRGGARSDRANIRPLSMGKCDYLARREVATGYVLHYVTAPLSVNLTWE